MHRLTRRFLASGPLDWSLVSGPVPVVVTVLGLLALLGLFVSRRRGWWLRWGPLALVAAGLTAWLLVTAVDDWWRPFPDGLTRNTAVWIGVGVLGVFLALFRLPGLRWRGRLGAVAAAALVLVLSAAQINGEFEQYPTLRALPGPWQVKVGGLSAADRVKEPTIAVPTGKTVEQVWKPPASMPAVGTLSTTAMPGTVSHFAARDAFVYLPPAYLVSPRPLLPVVVMMAGQPGSPDGLIAAVGIVDTLDRYAAAHHGLAPVVAVVDPLGSTFANTLCLDSRIARVQTYLATDVPQWIRTHLQTATDRGSWTVGGISFGGTCALQLAVNAPKVYGDFLDFSGQSEPTLGSHSETVAQAFGGDEAAFAKVNPLDVLKHTRFPDTAGALVVGASDGTYRPQQLEVLAACKGAGMQMTWLEVPGGHSYGVWKTGFEQELPWIAKRTGLAG